MPRLEPGDAAPDFTLTADDGRTVSLADYAGRHVIVYFYPRAFTPGCTTEAIDFSAQAERLAAAGYDIVGISPDAPERLAEFKERHGIPFTLLSDPDHEVAEAYGAWGKKKNYGREYEGIIRSTIVVGPDGRVERAWYNVRAKGHADRVVRALLDES
ncbi:MAG TPA: thioredoxin-dependent thiol peroxidase [Actinobacteria bacterium]|nr:thioredoxin-dependent thiol peroxidase [Actinomycetota bacterium]